MAEPSSNPCAEVFSVCSKCYHSFPSLHTYDFKADPYWNCSSRHELTWSPCSALSNNFTPLFSCMWCTLNSPVLQFLNWGGGRLSTWPHIFCSQVWVHWLSLHFHTAPVRFILGATLDIASDTRTGIKMWALAVVSSYPSDGEASPREALLDSKRMKGKGRNNGKGRYQSREGKKDRESNTGMGKHILACRCQEHQTNRI